MEIQQVYYYIFLNVFKLCGYLIGNEEDKFSSGAICDILFGKGDGAR